jgi:Phospholipase_D-nuclease N-terminal
MLFAGGFSFANFVLDVLTLFAFVVWFWLLITICGDLFRRDDVSGWAKALWVILVLVAPFLGVLAYMITQGRGMAERNTARIQRARDQLRSELGFSVADEIEKLDRLKKSGSITQDEFVRLRSKLVA